jgi:hypothetical protein
LIDVLYIPLNYLILVQHPLNKVQENQDDLGLNQMYKLLVYADSVSLFVENINTTERNTEALLNACKEVCQEVNQRKLINVNCRD